MSEFFHIRFVIVGLPPLGGPRFLATEYLDHIVGMLVEQLCDKNQNFGAMGSYLVKSGDSAKVPNMTP